MPDVKQRAGKSKEYPPLSEFLVNPNPLSKLSFRYLTLDTSTFKLPPSVRAQYSAYPVAYWKRFIPPPVPIRPSTSRIDTRRIKRRGGGSTSSTLKNGEQDKLPCGYVFSDLFVVYVNMQILENGLPSSAIYQKNSPPSMLLMLNKCLSFRCTKFAYSALSSQKIGSQKCILLLYFSFSLLLSALLHIYFFHMYGSNSIVFNHTLFSHRNSQANRKNFSFANVADMFILLFAMYFIYIYAY